VNNPIDSQFFGISGGLGAFADWHPEKRHELLTTMDSLGIKWSREDIAWSVMEPNPGEFHFQYFDSVVVSAAHHGISIMPMLGSTPAWASTYYYHRHDSTVWDGGCPPQNLYKSVWTNGSVDTSNSGLGISSTE
jgi:beta-galactosidase GanA